MRENSFQYNNNHYENKEEIPYNNFHNQDFSIRDEGGGEIPPEEEMPEEEKFFNDFIHVDIDNKDPSLRDNLVKIYEEEIPFEIRYENENEKNSFQSLIIKILITDEENDEIIIKIEIANDNDLFFYYTTKLTFGIFIKLKEEQKLKCSYNNISDLFIKYLDFCMNNPKTYFAVLNIKKDKKANMEIIENLEFKCAQLINLDFSPAPKALINQQISYRYNSLRAVENITQNKIDIINRVLKQCDPLLISEVKKSILKNKSDNTLMSIKIKNN